MPSIKRKKPKVPSVLLTPIVMPDYGRHARRTGRMKKYSAMGVFEGQQAFDKDEKEFRRKHLADETTKRWKAIWDHYGPSLPAENPFPMLLVLLANDFVDGFVIREQKLLGRKNTWDDHLYVKLWGAVQRLVQSKEYPDALSTCYHLAQQSPWKTLVKMKSKSRSTADNLYEQYMRAEKSPFVRFLKNLRKHHALTPHKTFDLNEALARILDEHAHDVINLRNRMDK